MTRFTRSFRSGANDERAARGEPARQGFPAKYGWSSWGELAVPVLLGLLGAAFVILARIEQYSPAYVGVLAILYLLLLVGELVRRRRRR